MSKKKGKKATQVQSNLWKLETKGQNCKNHLKHECTEIEQGNLLEKVEGQESMVLQAYDAKKEINKKSGCVCGSDQRHKGPSTA